MGVCFKMKSFVQQVAFRGLFVSAELKVFFSVSLSVSGTHNIYTGRLQSAGEEDFLKDNSMGSN